MSTNFTINYAVTKKTVRTTYDKYGKILGRNHAIGQLVTMEKPDTNCYGCHQPIQQNLLAVLDIEAPVFYCLDCVFLVNSISTATALCSNNLTYSLDDFLDALEKRKAKLVEFLLHEDGAELNWLHNEIHQIDLVIQKYHPEDTWADARREAKYGVGL